jgi:tetratricopeptide (TPR) repeat protein
MTDGASKEENVVATGARTQWKHCALLSVACALVIGVYIWSANSGVLELLGLKAENTYYNLLVQGFRAGQFNLKTGVPPGFAQLANPYDPAASKPYRFVYGNPLHDLSYYKGKLYLYFGITPALVLFWPYAALTGHYLLHKTAVVIFFSTGFLVSTGLLLAVWRRYFSVVSLWIVVPCIFALGLANFIPGILARCDVYEVPISCGYAMTMIALAGIWQALNQPQQRGRWLAMASLAYGLAIGARPSLLFGAVILLMPIIQAWQEKKRISLLVMAAATPIVLIGEGLMFYNAMRFDNPLEFGLGYQVTSNPADTTGQFSLRYLWFNFQVAFLEPAHWNSLFPFAHDVVVTSLPKGALPTEHPFGVLTNIPLVWLALAVPLAWRNRSTEERSTLRWFTAAASLLFGICALTILLHFSMCIRYEIEFTDVMILLAVIGVLALERVLAGQPAWRRAARCGWGLLLSFSVAFNLLTSFQLHAQTCCDLGTVLAQNGKVDEAIAQYRKALQTDPNCAQAFNNLGNALLQKGKMDEAIAQFHQALQIDPDSAVAQNNLGNALLQKGKVDEAIAQFHQALQIDFGFAVAQNNLGKALLRQGKMDEAIPHFAEAQYDLGDALLQQGNVDEAIQHLQQAVGIKPNYAVARYDLGNALLQEGRSEEAIENYRKTIQINPDYVEVLNSLSWILATSPDASLRNGDEAVEDGQKACALTHYQDPPLVGTLAAAYAEAGRFPEAITTAEKAEELATGDGLMDVAGKNRQWLKLYQAGKPYHEPSITGP